MKKLSDYKGDEAIELWGDLLDPISNILSDKKIASMMQEKAAKIKIAKAILKEHKEDAVAIMQRIDPAPVDGLNIIVRLIAILAEIGDSEDIKSFFGSAEQVKTDVVSFGSLTANIEDDVK